MIWRDCIGDAIRVGDMIEDSRTREIGRVIWKHGYPMMAAEKMFSPVTMQYEKIAKSAVDEAYIRCIVPRKTKLNYFLHGYRLDHIEILQKSPIERGMNLKR